MELLDSGELVPLPPVTTYVLKVASRCNLACTYCYMYEGPDQSWRRQPNLMSEETLEAALAQVAEYAQVNKLKSVSLVIHGGEPLLIGLTKLRSFLQVGRQVLGRANVDVNYSIQTNATLITPAIVELLQEHDVAVGVSLDGSVANHDRRRVDRSGRGSYSRVIDGIEMLRHYSGGKQPYSAIAVIDFNSDPVEQLQSLIELGFTRADFLLPDLNWDHVALVDQSQVGAWLIRMFDAYVTSESPMYLRTYQTILKLLLGGRWGSDAWGESSAGTLIIESDGEYEYHDALKTAFDGAGKSGKNVHTHPIAAVAQQPLMQLMTDRLAHIASACSGCEFKRVCGGGHIVHRYSTDNGFMNPSVYCGAIKLLLRHMNQVQLTESH
ncbi:radical SAM protein [Micromonospora sp. NPDC127501]|uniref:radical SAM protein n=1 Tax=Micromonospora sp. NPDC127501 TaxID=3154872 RepID=UPI0033324A20